MSNINLSKLTNKAEKYLKTAEVVINYGDYDTAISRIYYSMFYMVKALLITKNVSTKTHSGTLNKFSETFIKTKIFSEEIGKSFTSAYEKRLQGDYDFTSVLKKDEVKNFLKIGKEFVNILLIYLKSNKFV